MSAPLVSIATPTIPGREKQLARCMGRVLDLDWPNVEHVIVSDRRSSRSDIYQMWADLFADRVSQRDHDRVLTNVQINESWRNPMSEKSIACVPWGTAALLSMGEYVGFCGDDDELLPDHVTRHIEAMERDGLDFTVSVVEFRRDGVRAFDVGESFDHGAMDATGIMCRASALRVANWSVVTDGSGFEAAGDYRLVRDWRVAGLKGGTLPLPATCMHNDGWLAGLTGQPYDQT